MKFQLTFAYILLLLTASLPIGHLFIWENYTLFNTPLTHRIWITWSEIVIIFISLLIIPINLVQDIKNNAKLSTLLFAWVITGVISSSFSENIYASLARQVELCIHILFSYTLLNILNKTGKSKYLILGLICAFLYSLFYLLLLKIAVGNIEYEWSVDIPFFKNIRHWGYLQIIALPLSFYLILKRTHNYIGFIVFTLVWASIFWSGGRGSFITAFIVCFFVFPWLLKPRLNTYLACLMCSGIGLVLALAAEANHPSLSIHRLFFIKQDTHTPEGFDLNNYSAGRIDMYIDSIAHVFNNNYILGLGPDSFRYTSPPIHTLATHPHDLAIQLFYSYGVVGVLLISLISWIHFGKAARQTSLENKIASITLISAIIASIFDGVFYHSYSLYCLAIVFSIYLHSHNPTILNFSSTWNRTTLIILFLPLVTVWSLHTRTYYQFQNPLSSNKQLLTIEEFPSIILSKPWADNSDEKLTIKALHLGAKLSDNQCWHFLTLELLHEQNTHQKIKQHCHPSMLRFREKFNHE